MAQSLRDSSLKVDDVVLMAMQGGYDTHSTQLNQYARLLGEWKNRGVPLVHTASPTGNVGFMVSIIRCQWSATF